MNTRATYTLKYDGIVNVLNETLIGELLIGFNCSRISVGKLGLF